MSYRKVLTWPNPVLNKKSKDILEFDEGLKSIVHDMIDTLNVELGLGLAAPQIGINSNIVVLDTVTVEFDNPDPYPENEKYLVLINPKLTLSGDDIKWEEACLSVPGYSARVTRKESALVEYQDITGDHRSFSTSWPLSGIIQHECDHLEGILYLNRANHWDRARIQKKILRIRKLAARASAEANRREKLILRGLDPDDPRHRRNTNKNKKRKKKKNRSRKR
tara:strand:- start:380 stop:1045 length:666 start_codon:yes stop_codon:yes gene_type:complete